MHNVYFNRLFKVVLSFGALGSKYACLFGIMNCMCPDFFLFKKSLMFIYHFIHLVFFQTARSMIPAHTGQLAAIQFSPLGNRVATASDKGTVIRIFNVSDGTKVYELRRGIFWPFFKEILTIFFKKID